MLEKERKSASNFFSKTKKEKRSKLHVPGKMDQVCFASK